MIPRKTTFLLLVAAATVAPEAVRAQATDTRWYDGHVSLQAGVSIFDRSGVGTTGVYALRADMPIYPSLLIEAGMSYARPGGDSGVGDVFLPGLQVQLQGTSGQFSPYVGLGAGLTVEVPEEEGATDVSFSPSFSTGIRVAVSEGAALRLEGRLNAVGADFRGVYSEITAGLVVSW